MQTGPRLGFIGIGLMGEAMVLRLLERGRSVAIWNREPGRCAGVAAAGAEPMTDPRSVCEASDIVLMCVLDAPAVENCIFGPGGIAVARDGARLLIDHSTINPDAARGFAERLAAQGGMRFVDAPISGGPEAAREGRLTIMAGGAVEDLAAARPILADLGANITHLGPVGTGQSAKMLNQAIVGVGYVLMAETLALARAAGLAPERLPAALAGGTADSALLQRLFPRMAAAAFEPPSGYARILLKDLKNIAAYEHGLGLSLPLIERALARFAAHVDAGNAMRDGATIAELYERGGG